MPISSQILKVSALSLLLVALRAAVPPAPAHGFQAVPPTAQAARMHRGMDVSLDPPWRPASAPPLTPEHIRSLRKAGFDTVQLVLWPFSHMDSSNRLDPDWLMHLDQFVRTGLDLGMTVVLLHHDVGGYHEDKVAYRRKTDAFWQQFGEHYAQSSANLLFGLVGEPQDVFSPADWNRELRTTLAVIRKSNPRRIVRVAPVQPGGIPELPSLKLPASDKYLFAAVGYFTPRTFTHQGAEWDDSLKALSDVPWGSREDLATLKKDFVALRRWSREHHRPVFLSAFGTYEKAPLEARTTWTAQVARTSESLGIPWAYWQFDQNFMAYDLPHETWVLPVLSALVPGTSGHAAPPAP